MIAKGNEPDGNGADEERISSEERQGQLAGQFMGFGGLLRRWRKAAGVTQPPAARALGMGVRTYRKIERGATPPRFTRAQCDALATLLKLDRDERHALLLYNVGTSLDPSTTDSHPELRRALRLLVDRQMPSPTYLCDRYWNIIAFNTAMAEWWPWVMEPRANLMRWALTNQEARPQYHDWGKHASAYVKMLKFAEATNEDDAELRRLIEDVKKDPDVRHIWDTASELGETRDGHVFRMNVPALGWETVEVVSHVLYPASMPDCRFVVITWVEGDEEDDERDALGGARNAWANVSAAGRITSAREEAGARANQAEAERRRHAHMLTARLVVDSAEEAATLAGEDAVPLPVLSGLIGPDCRLTLAPAHRTVIWAAEEAPGEWAISEVDAQAVIARVPHAALLEEARAELKLLTRAALPAGSGAAVEHIQQLLPELEQRVNLLREIWRDLYEQDNALPPVRSSIDGF
ncbi:helix-turn-helix transcriptional regulator [Streptomyces sp. NPDC003077]|uniref:helix-turn-helix transcriptional regulator n=1 Tax=Streptomyces sp. NPDC003077 TaxID=3154443 RepID=UPI0033B5B5D8